MQKIEYIEVVNVINSPNNSSPGWDGIHSRLVKSVLNYNNNIQYLYMAV